MQLRILPIVLFFLFALVVAKVLDLAILKEGINSVSVQSGLLKSGLNALAQGQNDKPSSEKNQESKPQTPSSDSQTSGGDAKDKEAATKSAPESKDKKAEAGSENNKDAGKAENKDEATNDTATKNEDGVPQKNPPKNIEISDQVPMEKALLESLSKRRQELDEWANSISMKESVLNATEKKINNKMEELKKLETEVSALLTQYKSKEDEKNKKLVKIYEGMKPADAANIFNNMEISILLDIIGGMREDSAAKILSKMDIPKAKELTSKLSDQKRLALK